FNSTSSVPPRTGSRAIPTSSRTVVVTAPAPRNRSTYPLAADALAALERLGRAQLEVAAGERPRLARQRAVEVRGERADRDQRGDAERDAAEEHDEVAPGAARLTPRHAQGEPDAHAAPFAMRPSCSLTTRSARPASASSWVTSTSVDPWRRLSANSSS